MNDRQRSVIQQHFKQLADDIMMTEDLYGSLFQTKIFERNMIDIIRAEKTPQDQAYKMLSMLTKRGPDAFGLFIDIIKDDYPWLSTMLETSYKNSESLSRQDSMVTICLCGNNKMDNGTETHPLIKPTNEVPADSDIKTRVGQFIHKQFGHSKRISQTDKKSMEKWFTDQLQQERKKKQRVSASTEESLPDHRAETPSDPAPQTPDLVLQKLGQVFNKVRNENQTEPGNDDTYTQNGILDNFDDVDGILNAKLKAEEVVNLIDAETDRLINRLTEVESIITQCQYILGDHDNKRSLPDLAKETIAKTKQSERGLAKEKEKSEKMLNELYDYSKSISRLETERENLRQQLDKQAMELDSVKSVNSVLTEKCRIMELEKRHHLEKEKTIENLRKVIQDLKHVRGDENANYKSMYNFPRTSRRPTRVQTRRGSIDQGLTNGNSTFQKSVAKPSVPNISRRKQLSKY